MEMEIYQDHLHSMLAFVVKQVAKETTMANATNNNLNREVFIAEDLEVEAEPLWMVVFLVQN